MAFDFRGYNGFGQTWALAQGATGEAVQPPCSMLASSVQISGTFGGATVTVEVSNDGTNWLTLKDLGGTDITATGAKLVDFASAAGYVRARTTGGNGTTAITVNMIVWRG